MSLRDELIKILVEKLFLALILAAFGFYLNRLLEEFRSRLSFSTELNKVRVNKIADVWEKLYEFEQCAELSQTVGLGSRDRFQKLFDELHLLMQRNRFWIGEEAYDRINSYKVLLKNLTEVQDEAKAASLRAQVDGARQTVTDVRDRLLSTNR